MDPKEMQKEMLQVIKSNLETFFQSQQMLQDQGEKMLQLMLTQSDSLHAEGKKVLQTWLSNAKKANAEYKRVMEENLKKSEDLFGKTG